MSNYIYVDSYGYEYSIAHNDIMHAYIAIANNYI